MDETITDKMTPFDRIISSKELQTHQNIHTQTFEKTISSPLDIIDEIRPYLSETERNSIDSILNVFNMMQMLSTMEQMSSDAGTFNPMDMVKEMLTPEQQNMFEMYSTMFQENEDNQNEEGDS